MTPERFEAFTPEQARQLAAERDRLMRRIEYWWKRLVLAGGILLIGLLVGIVAGVHELNDARARGDEANQLAALVNHRLIEDANARAAESRKTAAKAAHDAYAQCRKQQESASLSREFFAAVLPRIDASRTPQQQRRVNRLYHEIQARHLLDVPKCSKPPKGS